MVIRESSMVRGYGVRDVAGYQVEVTGCYEERCSGGRDQAFRTAKREKIRRKRQYPFVVIQMEYTEKPIVFDA